MLGHLYPIGTHKLLDEDTFSERKIMGCATQPDKEPLRQDRLDQSHHGCPSALRDADPTEETLDRIAARSVICYQLDNDSEEVMNIRE